MVSCEAAPTDLAILNCRPLIPLETKGHWPQLKQLGGNGQTEVLGLVQGQSTGTPLRGVESGLVVIIRPLGGIRCERYDYVPCRLPQWRVSQDEPKDLKAAPEIPEDAEWKHWPVD